MRDKWHIKYSYWWRLIGQRIPEANQNVQIMLARLLADWQIEPEADLYRAGYKSLVAANPKHPVSKLLRVLIARTEQ